VPVNSGGSKDQEEDVRGSRRGGDQEGRGGVQGGKENN